VSRRWLRLDAQWDDTEWVMLLEPLAQLAWIKLLCYVKRDGRRGVAHALTSKAAAKKWGVTVRAVEDMIFQATQDGALRREGEKWVVTKWDYYQEPDATATERKRRQRDKEAESHAPVTPVSRRDTVARDHRPLTTDSTATTASAIADGGEPPTFGEVMKVVRSELCLNDSSETARSGDILRKQFAGKVPAQDVIDACRGARKLVEAGLVDGAKPGQAIGLRFLRAWHYDGRLLWDAAIDHERYGQARPTTTAKGHLTGLDEIVRKLAG
jgi:hypothetical protein